MMKALVLIWVAVLLLLMLVFWSDIGFGSWSLRVYRC